MDLPNPGIFPTQVFCIEGRFFYSLKATRKSLSSLHLFIHLKIHLGLPTGSAYHVGVPVSIPGSGRSSGEGNGNPLLYCGLENPMDRGTWWATVPGVSKSQTRLNDGVRITHKDILTSVTACVSTSTHLSLRVHIQPHLFLYAESFPEGFP